MNYPTVERALSGLQEEMIAKLKGYVKRMEAGEQVSMPEDEYDLLIEYLDSTNHPHDLKLASVWEDKEGGNLLAYFKGITGLPLDFK